MNSPKQPSQLHLGQKILKWYSANARNLPWRETKNPYKIWISEIVLQQTQVKQGLQHYLNFVERFPDVKTLANAETDEVLLYWKGLGYYSRAMNLHKAAQQVVEDFSGIFPIKYQDLLKLKGVGKYTAAAVASICGGEKIPAVDGNFYRVLSRLFADETDVSSPKAFVWFSSLALEMMPEEQAGDFNQAVMDLGSEICKPRNPLCGKCPLNEDCMAFSLGKISEFPVKNKKVKVQEMHLKYYFVQFQNNFLVRRRGTTHIWKNLYEFPDFLPEKFHKNIVGSKTILHKLTHKNLTIEIDKVVLQSQKEFEDFASQNAFEIMNYEDSQNKSFPKPLENYIENMNKTLF